MMGKIGSNLSFVDGLIRWLEKISGSITIWHVFFGVCIGVLLGVAVFLVLRCFEVGKAVKGMQGRIHDLEVRAFMDDDESPM